MAPAKDKQKQIAKKRSRLSGVGRAEGTSPSVLTEGEIYFVNKTYRSMGAVGGSHVILPKYVLEVTKNDDLILDYGAGTDAIQAFNLAEAGFWLTAYEIGENVRFHHSPRALDFCYNTVYASNVINVLPSVDAVERVVNELYTLVVAGGKLLFNFPNDPRHSEVSFGYISNDLLLGLFKAVIIEKYSAGFIFFAERASDDKNSKPLMRKEDCFLSINRWCQYAPQLTDEVLDSLIGRVTSLLADDAERNMQLDDVATLLTAEWRIRYPNTICPTLYARAMARGGFPKCYKGFRQTVDLTTKS